MLNGLLSYGKGDLKTVDSVDLQRYMGDWNVIAYIPNFIEKNCKSSVESYALREDGDIDNWFVCHKTDGKVVKLTSLASVENKQTNAEWGIRFNWDTCLGRIPIPFKFGYFILDLDPVNYSYTVVGHPSRNLLWVMAREKTMDEGIYQKLLLGAKDQGFDISKLVIISDNEDTRIH